MELNYAASLRIRSPTDNHSSLLQAAISRISHANDRAMMVASLLQGSTSRGAERLTRIALTAGGLSTFVRQEGRAGNGDGIRLTACTYIGQLRSTVPRNKRTLGKHMPLQYVLRIQDCMLPYVVVCPCFLETTTFVRIKVVLP